MSTEYIQEPLFPDPGSYTPIFPLQLPAFSPKQDEGKEFARLLQENKKLRRLVILLTDWNARSEEIATLRKELGM